jgi:hypothetical protein
MRWLGIALRCVLGACGFCDVVPADAQEQTVARAREVVLASEIALTAAERDAVLNQPPDTRYYDAFGPCQAEKAYFIEWRMAATMIQVHGIGNVLNLDDAEVRRVAVEG